MFKRLANASLRTQIVLLTTLPLVVLMIAAPMFLRPFASDLTAKDRDWANFTAGKLTLVTQQVQQAETAAEKSAMIDAAIKAGAALIAPGAAPPEVIDLQGLTGDEMRRRLSQHLMAMAERWTQAKDPVLVRIDASHALAVKIPSPDPYAPFLKAVGFDIARIAAIVFPMFLLAYFLAWRISFPLTHFAAAAKRISLEDDHQEPFIAQGPPEVASLADSLNAMQARVREMVQYRTRVLRAVSHDLRTPLTRLRMRAERCQEPGLRQQMLLDVTALTALIDDTTAYIGDTSVMEAPRRIDMASLLQTVVSDYQDMGLPITLIAPRRLAHHCRPRGVTRAVANLIDNAARYATRIEVSLETDDRGAAIIEVRDDGPGLPEDMKNKAIEPFFKADPARTAGEHSGFGLGLAIANGIASNHGGSLTLLDRMPQGLIVRIMLPEAK